jgi:UDP-glucose 4-epimerase
MPNQEKKSIIVFGATGNIGAYLTDWFNDKLKDSSEYEVIAVGRKKTDFYADNGIRYINVDITKAEDFDKLPSSNVYAIVHLAGILPAYYSSNEPYRYIDVNITGSVRILEYARQVGADRILYAQTWAEQAGFWGKEEVLSPSLGRKLKYTGDHAFYAITKSMFVETMEYYKQEFGIKNFVFRLPNVYLFHPEKEYYVDGVKRIIPYRYMIDCAASGKDLELWGDPNAFKDILYVKDLCNLMYCALFADINGGTYNAGTGIRTSLQEQIEGILDVFSPCIEKAKITYKPDKGGFTSFVMDISNAREELGYKPMYSYKSYLEDYKKEMLENRFAQLWGN